MKPGKLLKILFVGDESLGSFLKHVLCEKGVSNESEFVVLSSRKKAEEFIEKSGTDFDLFLVGGRIQEDDKAGLELVRFASAKCPELKIILMSITYNLAEAKAAGADDLWYTSPNYKELLELIEKIFAS